MGQLLQLGIVHHMMIVKEKVDQAGLSVNKLRDKLNEEMNMSLFDCHVTDNDISFVIKEAVVLEQLHRFMEVQYSLYDQGEDDTGTFDLTLHAISQLSSLQEIVELAEEKRFHCFQNSRIDDTLQVSPWKSLLIEVSVFTFFVEGRIYMEGYQSLLKYVENVVKASSQQSISGAFRASIE